MKLKEYFKDLGIGQRYWGPPGKVNEQECAAGAQVLTGTDSGAMLFDTPKTKTWMKGKSAKGNDKLARGTLMATFDGAGNYDGHALMYLGQDKKGMWVLDQFKGKPMAPEYYEYDDPPGPEQDPKKFYVVLCPDSSSGDKCCFQKQKANQKSR